ncbi:beta-fimbriae chaperone protein [Klebsiella oxytoca]|nr:beta-fimbriae chaperone protein [Klebsiella oxytoca]
MNLTNSDPHPSLLYTKVVDLADSDKSIRLIVTQPVVRVEQGDTQKIRFILQTSKPLQHEEFKRVTFEGIPPKEKEKTENNGHNSSGFTGHYPSGWPAGGARAVEASGLAQKGRPGGDQ